jgi:hypothetical protein
MRFLCVGECKDKRMRACMLAIAHVCMYVHACLVRIYASIHIYVELLRPYMYVYVHAR